MSIKWTWLSIVLIPLLLFSLPAAPVESLQAGSLRVSDLLLSTDLPGGNCGLPVSLSAEADSWIDQNSPSSNFAAAGVLKVQSKAGGNSRALMQFPLPLVPEGCILSSAMLYLHAASAATGRTLGVLSLAADWAEDSVTWNNQPATIGAAATAVSDFDVRRWDVTSQVEAMYLTGQNYGLLIRDMAEDGDGFEQQILSRENADDGPELLVWFTSAIPLDPTAPDTNITTAPVELTFESSASFGFTGTDDATPSQELAFQCRLDSQAEADFVDCRSPVNYAGLHPGVHTFEARAMDGENQIDLLPASFTWTILPPGGGGGELMSRLVSCGQVLTTSTRVLNNLSECPQDGLVIGADGIVIDLAGHTIDGVGLGTGIRNDGFDAVTVRNGTVQEFDYGVLLSSGARFNKITSLIVRSNQVTGIELLDHGTYGNQVRNNAIASNADGIALFESVEATVVLENTLNTNSGIGLFLQGSNGNLLRSNTIGVGSNAGILLEGASENILLDNALESAGDGGFLITLGSNDNRLRNNFVSGTSDAGFVIEGSNGNQLSGNTVTETGDSGFGLSDSHGNLLIGNTAHDNSDGGISLTASNDNAVQDNDVRFNPGGIELGGSSRNRIEGNEASFTTGNGIELGPGSLENWVVRNRVVGNSAHGISVQDDAPEGLGNLIETNIVSENGGGGIYIGKGGSTVRNNVTNNNRGWGIYAGDTGVDGGGNIATGNAEPQQCFNVICNAAPTPTLAPSPTLTPTFEAPPLTLTPTVTDRPTGTIEPPSETATITLTPEPTETPAPPAATDMPTDTPETPTVTPIPTVTVEPTSTPVPPSATNTPTSTRESPTTTPTPAPSPTHTSTATLEPTNTPERTSTPVPPTATYTPTATNTSTATATPSETPVPPTPTPTPSNTPEPPTSTHTFTATATATDTQAPPTATATQTPSSTSAPPTDTHTLTATVQPTQTPVPPSPTPTQTFTVQPTTTATQTRTNTPVPPTSTHTSTPTSTPPPTTTPTPTSSVTRTPTHTATSTVTLTLAPDQSLILTPVADASLYSGSPNNNYGAVSSLETDGSPIKHFLLKFVVTGIDGRQVTSAKLRLFNVNASNYGGDFRRALNTTWQEGTVTWNSAPAADPVTLASLGRVSTGNWYEVDLTSLIGTDGAYSLRITSPSSDGADYSSREGTNPPQLILQIAGGTSVSSTPAPTQTGTPSSSPSPSPTSTATRTPAPTSTFAPTVTAIATPTSTSTPTATNTHTPSPTSTPGSTPTPTATFTSTLTRTPSLTAPVSNLIFADGFEGGDLSAWSASVINNGNLSASPAAALTGNYGLRVNLNGTTAMYIRDDSPNTEPRYLAQFAFDPNSIAMSTGEYITLLQGYSGRQNILVLRFYRSSTGYQLRARAYDSVLANWVSLPFVPISDALHLLEIGWSNDGHVALWVDGVEQGRRTGIRNSNYRIDSIRLGATYISGSSISGAYYIDTFESRRETLIGP